MILAASQRWLSRQWQRLLPRLPGFLISQGIAWSIWLSSWANGYGWSLTLIHWVMLPFLITYEIIGLVIDEKRTLRQAEARRHPPTSRSA